MNSLRLSFFNVAFGITTCGNRCAILRGLCGRSLRLRTAHWAVRFTAQHVGREEALPWPMATKAW